MANILLLTNTFRPRVGGIERILWEQTSRSAHHFRIVLPEQLAGVGRSLREECYSEFYDGRFRWVAYLKKVVSLWSGTDVVMFGQRHGSVLPAIACQYGDMSCVAQVYAQDVAFSDSLRGRYRSALTSLGMRSLDGVIAISHWTAKQLLALGIKRENIEILHPGVQEKYLRNCKENPVRCSEPYTITTVGRLVKRKGHDTVIRALPSVRTVVDTRYRIVGEGPDFDRLQRLVRREGVADSVQFVGEKEGSDLLAEYKKSDLLVMPSRVVERGSVLSVEGFGVVFLEANAMRVPVIGGRSGGIPSAIRDGRTGIMVDPKDTNRLAHQIVSLLTDKDTRATLIENGRDWAEKHSWDRQVKRFDEIISRL